MKLVSAVMPTRGRCAMAAQAVECFHSQTYPNKELVILDDADEPSFATPPVGANIRYYRTDIHFWLQIPVKRNQVCELAQGEIIWNLDSDDWSAPERMTEQVRLLEATGRAVAGYHTMPFHKADTDEVYEYRSGPYYALGSSLAFLKSWWESHRFDEKYTHGSDTVFVRDARIVDKLISISPNGRMVARIHKGNTAPKRFTGPEFVKVSLDELPAGYLQTMECRTA